MEYPRCGLESGYSGARERERVKGVLLDAWNYGNATKGNRKVSLARACLLFM